MKTHNPPYYLPPLSPVMGKTPVHPVRQSTNPMNSEAPLLNHHRFTDCIGSPSRRRPIDSRHQLIDLYLEVNSPNATKWEMEKKSAADNRLDAWEFDLEEYIRKHDRLPCGCEHRRPGWFEYMDELVIAIGHKGNYLWRVDLDRDGNIKDSEVFTSLENACMFIQGFKYEASHH